MITKPFHSILFAGLVLSMGCIEEFVPEINNYENRLVVDGGISNAPGPYTVRLSLTTSVTEPVYVPVSMAEINIIDNAGQVIHLQEVEPGTYKTDSLAQGVPGRSYKIEITTPENQFYTSDYELLPEPVRIDTVYTETVTRQEVGYDYDLYGYAFYLDTEVATEKENYFKWDLEATYQYQSEYTIRWYYDGELNWFHGPDSLYYCWTHYRVGFYVGGTRALTEPVITKFPFHFVSTETRHLSVRYSLLVKQQTISRNAFEYWEEVAKQNGGEAGLYSTQPHFIQGNVSNISNPDEPVVGYFMVSGLDSMRIFADRPPPSVPMRYPVCKLTERDFEAYGQLGMMDPVFYPIYAIETPGGRRAVPNQDCVDCQRKGGTIYKPAYWIDIE